MKRDGTDCPLMHCQATRIISTTAQVMSKAWWAAYRRGRWKIQNDLLFTYFIATWSLAFESLGTLFTGFPDRFLCFAVRAASGSRVHENEENLELSLIMYSQLLFVGGLVQVTMQWLERASQLSDATLAPP